MQKQCCSGWCFVVLLGLLLAPAARAQIYTLPHADTSHASAFGIAVAIDGNRALVGASGESTCGPNSGAAYVYVRTPASDTWRRTARLVPSRCEAGAFFGQALDLSGDRAIVSASREFFADPTSNAAYIFERTGPGEWVETARLTAAPDVEEGAFATDVALDGNRALVTTSGSPEGEYGGAAYVFEYDSATQRWRRTARLTAEAGTRYGVLGGPCALDGDRFVVAASTYFQREAGSAYIFERTASGRWQQTARIPDVDDFFISVALSGRHVLVGEARAGDDESGAARIYEQHPSGAWTQVATLRPRTAYASGAFGTTVSLRDGRALITGYDEQLGQDFNIDRVVYVFERASGTAQWRQEQIIDIGEVDFGAALDQSRRFALISSIPNDKAGTVYVVRLF